MRYGVAPKDVRIAAVPTVVSSPWCDGKLTHASWKEAAQLEDFQVRMSGGKPSAQTRVLVFSDGRNLQVAFRCTEPDLARARKRKEKREEHVVLHLDAGLTRRRALSFTLFLSGRREGALPPEDWAAATSAGEKEWVGQFTLPFKSLGAEPAEGAVWGMALARCRFGRKTLVEVSTWGPSDLTVGNPRDFALILFRGRLSEAAALKAARAVRARLQAREDADDRRARAALGPAHAPAPQELPLKKGAKWTIGSQKVTVTSADNQQIVRSPHMFVYERTDEPQLAGLRERYALDSVVKGAKNDFEQAIRLQLWVIDHLNFGRPAHHDYNALKLLGDAERGRTFYCTHYSYVFMQCCMAMGIPTRKLSTIGHASNEFWSNHYRKWITIECTRGHYFEMGGVPLDALAVHNEYARNKGVDMDFSRGSERAIRKVSLKRQERGMIADAQERYAWFAVLMRNNVLSVPFALGEIRWLWYRDDFNRKLKELVIRKGERPHRFRERPGQGWEPIRIVTENPDDLYWTLNQAELHLTAGPSWVEVSAATVTPDFARFEARFDKGDWQRVDATFGWPLHTGRNRLEVRPVNAFARPGITSTITLSARGKP